MPVARGNNARVGQVDARQLDRCLGTGHRRLQGTSIDDHRLQVLPGNLQRGLGLGDCRLGLGIVGAGHIEFAAGDRAIGDQCLVALQVRGTLAGLGLAVVERGLALGDGRLGTAPLLLVVRQGGFLHRQLGLRLIQVLLVDPVIQAHQQVTGLDELEVLHRHFEHITAQLWPDQRDLPAHQGVLGAFDGAAERRQLPGIEHDQHADDGNRGKPQ